MSTSNKIQILLLGAGELGTSLLSSLFALPSTYTIVLGTRTGSKYHDNPYTHLLSTHPSLDLVTIDLSLPSAVLVPIFAQYDVIISATGFGGSPDSVVKLAREVVEAGKVRKRLMNEEGDVSYGREKLWFFPWQFGVDYDVTGDGEGLMPLFGKQKEVREILRGQDVVEWTVVSTGIFMSFIFEAFWGIVDRNNGKVVVRALRNWDHGVTVTDVHDIGRVMGRIVAGDVEARNQVVYVAGATVRYGELAGIIEKVVGKEVEREAWGMEYLEEEVRKDPEDGIKKYRLVFAREGVMWDKAGTVNAQLGMEMMGVEEYARKVFSAS
jgi:hypothetical protein